MTITFRCTSAVALTTAIVCTLFAPRLVHAQSQARAATDVPSQRAETRTQHDSLTAHFIRSPKGKPAELSARGGKRDAVKTRLLGRSEGAAVQPRVETPLPTRGPLSRKQ
jgi:hypothetical protein